MSRFRLGPLFVDHMVLQRDRENPVWGEDLPGHEVTLTVEGPSGAVTRRARADAGGRFVVACPALGAGGPYRLRVEGSEMRVLEDVMAGEVWLASGQSNMEWRVAVAANAERELDACDFPAIRMFKVERRAAREPERTAKGAWLVSGPDATAGFSAVGYFYARELQRSLGVPIGIIDATWGGTSIDAWISLEALRGLDPTLDARRARLAGEEAELPRIRAEYEKTLTEWERRVFPIDGENEGLARGWAAPEFDDRGWKRLRLPTFWQAHGMKFNGVVWFRRELELPADLEGTDLELRLGAIDDFDHTYFNGELVGAHPDGTPGAYQIDRCYRVPGRVVRAGRNVIAVRVFDHFGEGGFVGPPNAMFVAGPAHGRVRLDGDWRSAVEREVPLVPGDVFASYPAPPLVLAQEHAPAALFNGMLAPLLGYGIRGALWYQGETDVDRHAGYTARMIALIRDLRTRWGAGQFPFLFVQLAGFRASPAWPRLREAQARALGEPFTGMATAVDVGDPHDIHPRNKQEVGRRLALVARARVYGEPGVVDSGPILERVEIQGESARVFFTHADGLRSRRAGRLGGFALAGADGTFHAARAVIDGRAVLLTSDAVPAPCSVRYAWDDYPETDLENAAGLPALPFRTDGLD